MVYMRRLAELKRILHDRKIDAAIIAHLPNVRYLSGFTGTSGALVISAEKSLFVTDFRYEEQAKKQVSGFEVEIYKNPFDNFLGSILRKLGKKVMGFESNSVSHAQFERWASNANTKWVSLNRAVETLRMIKDNEELKSIKKAAKIVDDAFKYILAYIRPGVFERDIAIELEYFMRRHGAERSAFELIVASGRRSAMPHAANSFNKIRRNSFLVIDIGAVYEGYCSDMTRTVVVGQATGKQREIYQAVLDAQASAFDSIKCGKKASSVDKAARSILKKRGLGCYFGHNLGHGVGLEIHELPILGGRSENVLDPGMVFTIEPGVYIPNKEGVRIEDLLVLKKDGIELLTSSPRELIQLSTDI